MHNKNDQNKKKEKISEKTWDIDYNNSRNNRARQEP